MSANEYSAKQIQVLEGLEPVRKRPGMYIGSTDIVGLHECLREIVDNSVDESLAGHAKNVWVIINKDGSATVVDDGRGIPVDIVKNTGKSGLETVMTILHAGGKFGDGAYKVSGGLHGVGASVVNALSNQMWAEIRRDGKLYRQEFSRGVPQTELQTFKLSESKLHDTPIAAKFKKLKHGTAVTFMPDDSIFQTIAFENQMIMKMIQQRAFLVSGLYFHFFDLREEKIIEKNYYFEGGIKSLVRKLNENKGGLHPIIYMTKEVNDVLVEVALQYNDGITENLESFVNVINTINGGSHVTGFKMALTRAINDYGKKQNLFKSESETVTGDDAREGLRCRLRPRGAQPRRSRPRRRNRRCGAPPPCAP
ncbi:MAG TPA: ATP-binding protein [Candidatus Levybacteria bacterium]|nr:ATP-binding protein [Candidatus Levybacteria bacterium]